MKHTQGKWDVAKIISGDAVVYHSLIRADKKRSIATILQNSNAKANANLIASAPKLLQTLIDMLNMVNCWTPPSGDKDKEQSKKIVCNAIDIIAKAEGK